MITDAVTVLRYEVAVAVEEGSVIVVYSHLVWDLHSTQVGSIQTCVCVMVVKARSSSLGAAVAAAPTGVRPGYVIAPQPCVQQGYVLVWVVTGAVAVVVVIGAVLVVVVVPTVVGHTWGHGSVVLWMTVTVVVCSAAAVTAGIACATLAKATPTRMNEENIVGDEAQLR